MLGSEHVDAWYRNGNSFEWKENKVFYRDVAEGPAMLLIHGFPTASCDWADLADGLSPRFRLIAPDLLDYGRSLNRSGGRWHIHDQADMIGDLLASLDIASAHIVAHDVGDTVAQELVARHNEGSASFAIESLVLMNGGIFPAHHRPRPVQKLLLSPLGPLFTRLLSREKFTSALAEVFGPQTRPGADAKDALWDVSVGVNGARSFARRIHYMKDRRRYEDRWVGALKKAGFPMMMINGTADPVSGGHVCDVIERELPAMKLVRLDGIGHFPLLETPDVCLAHILAFHQAN
jgi:pimeloyl-ACP methyl ester carboxylesterase